MEELLIVNFYLIILKGSGYIIMMENLTNIFFMIFSCLESFRNTIAFTLRHQRSEFRSGSAFTNTIAFTKTTKIQ